MSATGSAILVGLANQPVKAGLKVRVRKRWGMSCSTGVKSDQGMPPFQRLLIGFHVRIDICMGTGYFYLREFRGLSEAN